MSPRPVRDKYATCFYSPLVMDHFCSKAIENATKYIIGFVTEGQDAAEGWQGLKSKGKERTREEIGFRKR